jgi:hypothetical protein
MESHEEESFCEELLQRKNKGHPYEKKVSQDMGLFNEYNSA